MRKRQMSNISEAANFLKSRDNIEIYSHIHPDGDTTGSSFALCAALLKLGKKARVVCLDSFPESFSYIHSLEMPDFEPETTVSVDVATRNLLGKEFPENKQIHLAIDHHLNNTTEADIIVCDPTRSAAGELVYELPNVHQIREYCLSEVDKLWDEVKRFENPHTYYVDLSQKLWDIKHEMLKQENNENR
jgi:nanoRNase/pAp phosphatase (c-di-AMP/oligoRNAs hydrolase)